MNYGTSFQSTEELTKREYFAANAPEVPEWFIHTELPKPEKPNSWNNIKWANKEDEETVRQWQYDPIFDLPTHLMWYQEMWSEYNESRNEWQKKDDINRYFQWRTFYADNLIKELNKDQ